MGDVIQFPVKKKDPEVVDERLARIKARLEEINKLMEKLRNDNPRNRDSD